jgi:hypothetical protein
MSEKIILFGEDILKRNSDGNLTYAGRKILDDENARFADLHDVNIPSEISSLDSDKIIKANYISATPYGDASLGNVTLSSPGPINYYTDLIADVGVGETVLPVSNATSFVGVTQVLVHQTQNYRWHNNTSDPTESRMKYEIRNVLGVDVGNNLIVLADPLNTAYKSDSNGNKKFNTKTQIVSVPQYNTLTINASLSCKAWDGYSGGIIVFRARVLSGNSSINVTGLGFRGIMTPHAYGAGEGWDGLGDTSYNRGGGQGNEVGGWNYASGGHHGAGGSVGNGVGGVSYGLDDADLETYLTLGGAGWSDASANAAGAVLAFVESFSTWSGSWIAEGTIVGVRGGGAGGSILIYTPTNQVPNIGYVSVAGAGTAPYGSAVGYQLTTQPTEEPVKQYVLGQKVSAILDADKDTEIPTSKGVATFALARDGSNSITGNLIPDTAGTRDLGSSEKPFRDIYASEGSIYLGEKAISIVDDNIHKSGEKVLDTGNALFADIRDVNIPTTLIQADNNKVLKATFEVENVYGDESDGDVTVSGTEIINSYTDLISDASVGATTIYVRDSSGFQAGNEILIITSQIYRQTTVDNLGLYEFATIAEVPTSAQIILSGGLSRTYLSDANGNKSNNTKTQIVKVPQYGTLNVSGTITAKQWDGYSGGVIAFMAKDLVGSGSISVKGKGYRGGAVSAQDGEGWFGSDPNEAAQGSGQGPGGSPQSSGGGGHLNNGSAGSYGAYYGLAYGLTVDQVETNITFGGAGGAANANNWGAGGNSGGIIFTYIQDPSVFNGALDARGNDGVPNSGGNGGPGAGGSILIYHDTVVSSTLNVQGGAVTGTGSVGRSKQTSPSPATTRQYELGAKISTSLDKTKDTEIPTSKAVAAYCLLPMPPITVDVASRGLTSEDSGHILDTIYADGTVTYSIDVGVMAQYDEFIINRLTVQSVLVSSATGVTINGIDGATIEITDQFGMITIRMYGPNNAQVIGNFTTVI